MSAVRILITNKNKLNASERYGHISILYQDRYLVVIGGYNYDQRNIQNYLNPDVDYVWIFDTINELWNYYTTTGEKPYNPLSGACGLLYQDDVYVFGGFLRGSHTNKIYKLNLKTFEWVNCTPKGKLPSPRDKLSGWVKDDKLYYFGGFGDIITDVFINDCGQFDADETTVNYDGFNLGWNNQLLYFDTTTRTWHNPIYGKNSSTPLPRAAHTCVYMSDNKVVLFGGRIRAERTNDLYILDLDNYTWKGNLKTLTNENPTGRSWATMVKLNDDEVFIYGGFTGDFDALSDSWILNIKSLNWTQIRIRNLERRLWHSANIVDRTKQIYVFGGCSKSFSNDAPDLPKHILKISVYPESLKDKCLDFICSNLSLYKSELEFEKKLPVELLNYIQKKCGNLISSLELENL